MMGEGIQHVHVCVLGVGGVSGCAQGVGSIPHFQLCLHISRSLMLIGKHVEMLAGSNCEDTRNVP